MSLLSLLIGLVAGAILGGMAAIRVSVPLVLDRALVAAEASGARRGEFLQQVSFQLGVLHKYLQARAKRRSQLEEILQHHPMDEALRAAILREWLART